MIGAAGRVLQLISKSRAAHSIEGNRRSLVFARDDKGKGGAFIEFEC